MKNELNNLAALVQGKEMNFLQRYLAVAEFESIIEHLQQIENENKANKDNSQPPNCIDIEDSYFDKKGKTIKEFAVLKVYHFFGVNEQGKGRKHYYMYKWVRLKEYKGKKYWIAMHLNSDKESNYYNLRAVADKQTRIIKDAEIVQ